MRVSMVVSNDLASDQRVLKMGHTLHQWGHQVHLCGRLRKHSPALPKYPFQTQRISLLFESGPLFYIALQCRLFVHLLFSHQDAIHANDLDTLLPAWLVSKIKGIQLVYDTHEYFTGVPELSKRPIIRKIWRTVESFIFPRLEKVITVNQSIAALYEHDYQVLPKVIRNIPSGQMHVQAVERKQLQLPDDYFIMVLQGNGINVDRGAEEAVAMMQHLENALLLIIGSGDIIQQLKQYVKEYRLENKVRFLPRMPYSEMLEYTTLCDIGLSLDKDSNINYRYSLPNKLFDYFRAGIPVLVSDLPEVRKIIEESGAGLISHSHKPELLAEIISGLRSDIERLKLLRSKAQQASARYNWDSEVQCIRAWYQ